MDHPRIADIDAHWVREFGLPSGFLPATGFTLVPSPDLEKTDITVVHRLHATTVILVAPSRAPGLRRALFAAATEDGVTTEDLGAHMADSEAAPDWHETVYYLPPNGFTQDEKHMALPLDESSAHLLDHLLQACGTAERGANSKRLRRVTGSLPCSLIKAANCRYFS